MAVGRIVDDRTQINGLSAHRRYLLHTSVFLQVNDFLALLAEHADTIEKVAGAEQSGPLTLGHAREVEAGRRPE